MTIFVPGKVTLRQTWQPMDPDAAAYITAVETADGQALEEKVKIAIDNFVLGCKADGIWNAIKASCILAGARTLAGALVPLVKQPADSAPTRFGTEGGWNYNRETGLQGNGTDNYINSGRNNNADPQNSNHNAVYVKTAASSTSAYMGVSASTTGSGVNNFGVAGTIFARQRNTTGISNLDSANAVGLLATNRSSPSFYVLRAEKQSKTVSQVSQIPFSEDLSVFASGLGGFPTDARLAFYSIGEALDLTRLDARVTDLINAIGVAIP